MPPTTNRRIRSINLDDDRNRSLAERRDPIVEGDSDSLMSGGGSEDDDDGDEDENEVEEEIIESGNRNRTSHIFKGEFIMPPYEHAKRQLSQLYELMNGQYLDLAPHYQRGVVWSRKAMRLLIDSMWKGYYIPPVIFNLEIVKDENGGMRFKRTCVDGKQRLTSIRDFMSGQFPCLINKTPWYFCAPPGPPRQGPRRKILPEAAREEFKRIEILCTEYKGLTERQEIELFQRVQLGKPLSQAEAFRATQGSWQEFAKLYERDFSDVINLVKQNRASGFRSVLSCFMQIYECIDPTGADGIPKFKNSIKSIESFCSNAVLDLDTKNHLRIVFTQFHDLVEEDRSTFESNDYTRTKTFSPIELVGVSCLLSEKGGERPNGMLRGDILAMRRHLREVHSDLRMNKECWQTVWRFIDKLEYYRGAVNGTTVRKAPAKAIKRKPRPRPQPEAGAIVEDVPVSSGNGNQSRLLAKASQRPPAANMSRPDPQSKSTAGPATLERNAASTSFISQLSAAASLDRAADRDLNHPLSTTRTNASPSSTPWIPSPATAENTTGQNAAGQNTAGQNAAGQNTTGQNAAGQNIAGQSPAGQSPTGPAPMPRKRIALDLGSSASGNQELEFKKARLMAGYVKQERDG